MPDSPNPPASPADPQATALYRRVLEGNPAAAQVWFSQHVLDRYRADPNYRVIRTNTVGRLRLPSNVSLDFGIADEDRVIHLSQGDLAERLPQTERPHWLQHLVIPPASKTFLSMRLAVGACIDDGDVRDWTVEEGRS